MQKCLLKGTEPVFRWAGGKQKLLKDLVRYLPPKIEKLKYHEPFLGAGSLFFHIAAKNAVLCDLNRHLIDCYTELATQPRKVSFHLQKHAAQNSPEYYYEVREEYNSGRRSPAQAARFIYLNRTCFNGIFRVNTKGKFNVPYGYKKTPIFPDTEHLLRVAEKLVGCKLNALGFEESLKMVKEGEFAYLDPPYPPLNGTSFFTHYTAERFSADLQNSLCEHVKMISDRGALFMMSNADTELIRELYKDFNIYELSVVRYITCKAKKHRVGELIVTNYRG